MKANQLILGDCTVVMNTDMKPESVDLIFADPPYNLSGTALSWKGNTTGGDWFKVNEKWDRMPAAKYFEFTRAWIQASYRVLKSTGSLYVSCSHHNLGEVMVAMKEADFKINNIITWQKTNAMPNMTKRVYTHSTEFVVFGVKGKGWTFNYDVLKEINPDKQKDGSLKQMRDVWQLPLVQGKERIRGKDNRAIHPTQKPEELLRRIILASSNRGDVVLDPFVGSGTTTAVAKRLGRKWVGIEKDRTYFKVSEKRMQG
jgi:site-specific DNA-methyltransferase (adenine-specific)